jgi:hypothetical protein
MIYVEERLRNIELEVPGRFKYLPTQEDLE